MALGMANGTLTNCMYCKIFDRFWNSFSSWDVLRSQTQGFVRKADTLRSRLAQLRVIVVDDRSLCMIAEIWKHCDVEADTSQNEFEKGLKTGRQHFHAIKNTLHSFEYSYSDNKEFLGSRRFSNSAICHSWLYLWEPTIDFIANQDSYFSVTSDLTKNEVFLCCGLLCKRSSQWKHHVTPTTCIVPALPEVIHRDLFKPIKVTVYI